MAPIQPNERAVYMALRHVLVAGDSQLRALKKIKEKIRLQNSAALTALVQEHNLENVANVAKRLLEDKIFQSTSKAKLRFPELFEASVTQSAGRADPGQEVIGAEDDSHKRAAEDHQRTQTSACSLMDCSGTDTITSSHKMSHAEITACLPSLYPVYLPMRTQHLLMNELQTILEKASYEFGLVNMPNLLQERGWTCAECVELNEWLKIIASFEGKMSEEAIRTNDKPLSSLLTDMAQIRHIAVHRVPVTADQIELFLANAESLARVLDNDIRGEMIAQLRRETKFAVDEIKRNKDVLQSRSVETMGRIRRQQAELECELRRAIEKMLREDKEFQLVKGEALEQEIRFAASAKPSVGSEPVEEATESWRWW
ncbi:hypothetical protein CBER1_11771 [Cercospora berteroae]|uniref:Ubiquinol-cytochrome-c reductase cytochrome c1 n=1 Tax=Cercospora berteroae TaxID=357750 RepID=A0A2S6BZN3_9PEZI|nr:hypothetical protein CBER1_11771 [Cercospora berteroae]